GGGALSRARRRGACGSRCDEALHGVVSRPSSPGDASGGRRRPRERGDAESLNVWSAPPRHRGVIWVGSFVRTPSTTPGRRRRSASLSLLTGRAHGRGRRRLTVDVTPGAILDETIGREFQSVPLTAHPWIRIDARGFVGSTTRRAGSTTP